MVHPIATRSQLWTRDALRPLPRSLHGGPARRRGAGRLGVLSAAGLRRVRAEPSLPPTELDDDDVSVGELVADRLGEEVVDRLVEPLLGGVYAGHARELSARATTPQLVAMLDRGSLLEAAAAAVPVSMIPVFAGLPGGLGGLPVALLASGRFTARTDATVRELRRVEARLRAGGRLRSPARAGARRRGRPGGAGHPGRRGCWATWRRRRPRSWPRSSTRPRRW